jgi:TATA-binding protein-associated factor Taf7
MFNKVQEGIEDIDIQVPEMHIRVPDLLKDLLSSASSKINQAPEPVTHVFKTDKSEGEQSKEEDLEQGAHDDSQQQQNMPNVVPVVKVEEEAEEEEEEEEDEEENEVNRLARQDQQFMLLCRKFSDIRKSLISINHKVIPAIPTIVLIGSHNADRANILETILEQEVTLR